MNYELLKTPNSRLLYGRCQAGASNWEQILLKLESFLEKESQLQTASSETFLYFFLPSKAAGFNELESWVAREVIGFPQSLDESKGMALYDLEQGECISLKGSNETFCFLDLWSEESKYRDALAREFELADTWRLKLERVGPKTELEFQFFAV